MVVALSPKTIDVDPSEQLQNEQSPEKAGSPQQVDADAEEVCQDFPGSEQCPENTLLNMVQTNIANATHRVKPNFSTPEIHFNTSSVLKPNLINETCFTSNLPPVQPASDHIGHFRCAEQKEQILSGIQSLNTGVKAPLLNLGVSTGPFDVSNPSSKLSNVHNLNGNGNLTDVAPGSDIKNFKLANFSTPISMVPKFKPIDLQLPESFNTPLVNTEYIPEWEPNLITNGMNKIGGGLAKTLPFDFTANLPSITPIASSIGSLVPRGINPISLRGLNPGGAGMNGNLSMNRNMSMNNKFNLRGGTQIPSHVHIPPGAKVEVIDGITTVTTILPAGSSPPKTFSTSLSKGGTIGMKPQKLMGDEEGELASQNNVVYCRDDKLMAIDLTFGPVTVKNSNSEVTKCNEYIQNVSGSPNKELAELGTITKESDFFINDFPMLLHVNHPTDSGETGWRVWDAGIVMSKFMEKQMQMLSQSRNLSEYKVLDLGCGSGISGLACALCGCDVVLSDLEIIRERTEQNVVMNMDNVMRNGGKCSFLSLDWKDKSDSWDINLPPHHFDLIIASDVTWAKTFVIPFVSILRKLIDRQKVPETTDSNANVVTDSEYTVVPTIYLANKTRDINVTEYLLKTLEENGLTVSDSMISGNMDMNEEYYHERVNVYCISELVVSSGSEVEVMGGDVVSEEPIKVEEKCEESEPQSEAKKSTKNKKGKKRHQ